MPSLHRDNRLTPDGHLKTPYWIAAYTDQFGRRRKRSTKKTSQKDAQKVLNGWLKAIDAARDGRLTEARAREIIGEIYAEASKGKKLYTPTVEEYLNDWLASERPSLAENSYVKKAQAVRLLLESLGERKFLSLEAIADGDIVKFRDELLAAGRRASTVNGLVRKFIAQAFRAAHKKGLIRIDPVAGLKAVRQPKAEKHTFTEEQVQRLINTAKDDWKGTIITGFYSGARLGDIVNLTWDNVDLFKRTITFTQKKTDEKIQIPVAEPLHDYLLSLPMKDGAQPVFPSLYGKTSGGKSGLSMAFGRLMERAGIEQGSIRERVGGLSRKVSARSFHSLRHSFNSILANANVPQELRMKLTGHSSIDMNDGYTHHEMDVIRGALEHLPRLAIG